MSAVPDWSTDLEPGEALLWSGRPEAGRRYTRGDLGLSAIGLFVLVFALAWILFAVSFIGDPALAPVPPFAAPFLVFCVTVALLSLWLASWLLWRSWLARERMLERSFYALTPLRALIRVAPPEMKLTSWPISPDTVVEVIGDPSRRAASLHMATLVTLDSDGDRNYTQTGFERISDARAVLALIRQIQTGSLSARQTPVPSDNR